jgi:hypothetical protein
VNLCTKTTATSITDMRLAAGISFALLSRLAGTPMRLVYDEPTVMWRMRRADALCHVVITPLPWGAAVEWFLNDRPLGHRDFSELGDALRWTEQLQAQNWSSGWRLLSE